MGTKVDGKRVKLAGDPAQAAVWENPLVPNVVLREMYRKMVELRLLEEHAQRLLRRSAAKSEWKSIHGQEAWGQEACRVIVAQSLGDDDLVLDSQPGAAMEYLLGAELTKVLGKIDPRKLRTKRGVAAHKPAERASGGTNRLLPWVKETEARLFAGLGAALLLKSLKRNDGLVIYLDPKEAGNGLYRRAFTLAATQELAVIFFVLPESGQAKLKAKLIALAHGCGVPGMTVEASDAIALYRVVQESMGRVRAGGGPVLIVGVAFPGAEGREGMERDPIDQLGRYLLNRRVCTEGWIAATEQRFRRRLATAKRS